MGDIKISIEVRIEAGTESAARQYAAVHGIDGTLAKWFPNPVGKGGRLYATAAMPFSIPAFPVNSAADPRVDSPLCSHPDNAMSRTDIRHPTRQ